MAKNTRIYTDLDLNFTANPVTGDVSSKYDENAIKQSIKNLIMTHHYERPFHPEIGSQVHSLLFDNFSPMTQVMMEQAIRNTIENNEPRVRLNSVSVDLQNDDMTANISIVFTIVNIQQPIQLDFTLRRTR
jgi:phage baseplate assembly protein W